MGLRRLSWIVLLLLSCVHYCFGGQGGGGGGSGLVVKFVKAPLPFSSLNSAAFGFEVLESGHCGNCSFQCKLDDGDSLNCDAREVSYTGLLDGNHTLEVCTNGSKGVRCASYNWIVG
ncbi:hypothetical protein QJS04_geneDACA002793 [Acorus gramineus]|uniref:Uncharacterized protein n=1 Tax=Acorus gramineus TaxID=55184 RepID=A0AAV9BUJ7_ACOGR|nr:hypothetical protein QJS04_geneDACA002793 [Acorus gramineus]